MSFIVDMAAASVGLVFAFALIEKAVVLAERRTEWHPVIVATPFLRQRRRVAQSAMAIAAVADATVVLVLLASPRRSMILAVALLVVYTAIGRGAVGPARSGGSSCGCFVWGLDVQTREALYIRNVICLIAALVGLNASGVAIWEVVAALGGVVSIGAAKSYWAKERRAEALPDRAARSDAPKERSVRASHQ